MSKADKKRELGVKHNCFYLIEKSEDEYSLWVIDTVPESLEESDVEKFISEHETDGHSITGSYMEITKALKEFLQGQTADRKLY